MSLFEAAKPLEELRVSSISSEGCSMSLGISQTRVRGYRSDVTYLSNQRSSSSTGCRAARRARPSVDAASRAALAAASPAWTTAHVLIKRVVE